MAYEHLNYEQVKVLIKHLIETGHFIPDKSWAETDAEIRHFIAPKQTWGGPDTPERSPLSRIEELKRMKKQELEEKK